MTKMTRKSLAVCVSLCGVCVLLGMYVMDLAKAVSISLDGSSQRPEKVCRTLEMPGAQIQQKRLDRLHTACQKLGISSTLTIEQIKEFRRKTMVDSEHRVLLVAPPKTGSSTWKSTLLNSSGTFILKPGQRLNVQNESNFRANKELHSRYGSSHTPEYIASALNNYCTILNVRHPFDRLESAFVDKIESHKIKIGVNQKKAKKGFKKVEFHEYLEIAKSRYNRHWSSLAEHAFPCRIPYRYISKTETMTNDLDIVTNQMLSGHGMNGNRNVKRNVTILPKTQGRHLPFFSQLENKVAVIEELATIYKKDMQLFGYSYRIDSNGVFATCVEYDASGNCI